MNITVASFPRSGNHRTREMIYSLMTGKPFLFEPVSIKRTEISPIIKAFDYLDINGVKKSHEKAQWIQGKVVYCIRHPFDCALSWHKFIPSQTIQESISKVINGFPEQQYWGSWNENVESFLNRPNTLILKYEDWGEEELKRLANFLGLQYNEKILEWNNKEVISERERQFIKSGYKYKKHIRDEQIVYLSDEQKELIINSCSNVMKKIGY